MTGHTDRVWQGEDLVRTFLEGVRGGIPLAAEQIRIIQHLVRHHGGEVCSVLDLGCGDGILAAALLEVYPGATVTLVDFSQPMLNAAREKLGPESDQIRYVEADFGDPDWVSHVRERAPFDVVVSGFAIHHQTDERKRELYAEVLDLLAPGGAFLNMEHVSSRGRWSELANQELFVDTITAFRHSLGESVTREDVARKFVNRDDKDANILAPVEEQCTWLRDIGYTDVDVYFKVFELALFGGKKPI